MRGLIAGAVILALSACAQPAREEAPVADEAMTAEVVEGAGTFEYSAGDGTATGRIVMNEDGTYADTYEGETSTGKWRMEDGQTCFMPDEEGAEEACWNDGEPDENGTFVSTAPDGTTVTVTPIAEDAATETESEA